MGVVALIGLLIGGPAGVCFALAYGVVSVMKIGKVDSQYAARGETPPSYRLVEKWLEGRKARGLAPKDAKPARYGMWRYAFQRWSAMWELLGEEHRAQFEAQKKARAAARAKGEPLPKKPPLRERLAQLKAWRWTVDTIVSPVGEKKAEQVVDETKADATPAEARIACEDCGQTLLERDGHWDHPSSSGCPAGQDDEWLTPDPDEPTGDAVHTDDHTYCLGCKECKKPSHGWRCDICGTDHGGFGSEEEAKADSGNTPCVEKPLTAREFCKQHGDAAAAAYNLGDWATADRHLAQIEERYPSLYHDPYLGMTVRNNDPGGGVHQASLPETRRDIQRRINTAPAEPTQGDTMTQTMQQSGEVTGLTSAINYAAAVAAAHEAHSLGGGETYMASLAQAEVGPETIQTAAAAQEASAIAAGAWRTHEAKLQEQLTAKEAITSETGKKDFLLAD